MNTTIDFNVLSVFMSFESVTYLHYFVGSDRSLHNFFTHSTSYYSEFTSVFVRLTVSWVYLSQTHSITSIFVLQRDPGRAWGGESADWRTGVGFASEVADQSGPERLASRLSDSPFGWPRPASILSLPRKPTHRQPSLANCLIPSSLNPYPCQLFILWDFVHFLCCGILSCGILSVGILSCGILSCGILSGYRFKHQAIIFATQDCVPIDFLFPGICQYFPVIPSISR